MADLERGKRIKALREAKGQRVGHKITQPQMAEAVGVTLRAAQEWEYGGGIDEENLPTLLEFLETDADYLLRGKGSNNDTPDLLGTLEDVDQEQLDRIEAELREQRNMLQTLLRRTRRPPAAPDTVPLDDDDLPPDEPIPGEPPAPTEPPADEGTGGETP